MTKNIPCWGQRKKILLRDTATTWVRIENFKVASDLLDVAGEESWAQIKIACKIDTRGPALPVARMIQVVSCALLWEISVVVEFFKCIYLLWVHSEQETTNLIFSIQKYSNIHICVLSNWWDKMYTLSPHVSSCYDKTLDKAIQGRKGLL